MSFFAAAKGAARVVALEPEAAGSRGGVSERIARTIGKLADLAKPGATLIVCDASRQDFFARIGSRLLLGNRLASTSSPACSGS